jgi:hypothetical protein
MPVRLSVLANALCQHRRLTEEQHVMSKTKFSFMRAAFVLAPLIGGACGTVPGSLEAPAGDSLLGDTPTPPTGYSFSGMTASPTSGNTWQTRTRMTFSRSHTAAAEINGQIYVAGGASAVPVFTILDRLEVYDPVSDTWNTLRNMPTKRWDFAGAAANGKFYCMGGRPQAGGLSPVVEEYDPATDTWLGKTNMISARAAFAAVTVNNKIYAICGEGSNVIEEFDPIANTWTAKTAVPNAPQQHGAAVVNGLIYVVGGNNGPGGASNVVFAYDPAQSTFTPMNPIPTPRTYLGVAAVGAIVFAFGGSNSEPHYFDALETFDVGLNLGSGRPGGKFARHGVALVPAGGKLYAIGGFDFSGSLNTNEEFTPAPVFYVFKKN